MNIALVPKIEALCRGYRRELFEKFLSLGQGHPGSTFSMLEIVVTLYHGGFIRFNRQESRFIDKVIVSKGHATVALYPILANFGVIKQSEWDKWGSGESTLRVFGNTSIPGIDVTSGSLGHGVGVGIGMAIARAERSPSSRVFVIISEGELYEGSTWEALLIATHKKLKNFTIIVDVNSLIILGKTADCVGLEPIEGKISAFGINTHSVDGHNVMELINTFSNLKNDAPQCVIAKTTKGKGFSIMEGRPEWHYWNSLNHEQISLCRKEVS